MAFLGHRVRRRGPDRPVLVPGWARCFSSPDRRAGGRGHQLGYRYCPLPAPIPNPQGPTCLRLPIGGRLRRSLGGVDCPDAHPTAACHRGRGRGRALAGSGRHHGGVLDLVHVARPNAGSSDQRLSLPGPGRGARRIGRDPGGTPLFPPRSGRRVGPRGDLRDRTSALDPLKPPRPAGPFLRDPPPAGPRCFRRTREGLRSATLSWPVTLRRFRSPCNPRMSRPRRGGIRQRSRSSSSPSFLSPRAVSTCTPETRPIQGPPPSRPHPSSCRQDRRRTPI